ncbi:MAG TPA: tetratricopeptide repeat protein [Pseudomonadales bacterium]
MIFQRLLIIFVSLFLPSCAFLTQKGTIGQLDSVVINIKDEKIEGGLEKAMQSYQKFLEETPESALTPEAIRRLADLKITKEYGVITDAKDIDRIQESGSAINKHEVNAIIKTAPTPHTDEQAPTIADLSESEKQFEKRASTQQKIESKGNIQPPLPPGEAADDLENAGAEEAIILYQKLLAKYPLYERNDQVLYQLSRAYEELGKVEKAMEVMNKLVSKHPDSRYMDEVQFRRAEYFFTRKKYLDAEEAYLSVLKLGIASVYYESALYKLGWTFYKQDMYEEAINQFMAIFDYKVSIGYDFEQTESEIEKKRIDDTFRVISLSFSNMGGADSVINYFNKYGAKPYEDGIYSHLAEYYFDKRRYSDAALTYNAFIERNPFNKVSPHFSMRTIEIYMKGGFPRLVIDAKKQFASTYGIHAEYWNHFNKTEFPKVLDHLKTNLTDLANHYHALYQNKKFADQKNENFGEASHWYHEFLSSFPQDEQSAAINYQLAELLLENKNFNLAAIQYERTAYEYAVNKQSPKAAYAAVYAYREHFNLAPPAQKNSIKREVIRSSLRLVDTFPKHEKVTVVLGAAIDDIYSMKDYELAIRTGHRLIKEFPDAERSIKHGAWLVIAYSSFELEKYSDAEIAYIEVLNITPEQDKDRIKFIDNLAASIYKQGELANINAEYETAVKHFLRIATLAPSSKIRSTAEYDAAAILVQTKNFEQAESVLLAFRETYPQHQLQHDVTKKIAYVYKESEKYSQAALEFERIETESKDDDIRREALLTAAQLYEKTNDTDNALRVYKKYVVYFPTPIEFALETQFKIATVYKDRNQIKAYRETLQHIINTDANAGSERTDRTRYLAAQAALVIIEPEFDRFIALKITKPFKSNLTKKQTTMKSLVKKYNGLVDYGVADVTAAATYYIAEIYFNFNVALMESERPDDLNALELEQYNLVLEEQAYPFEEKAISVHEKNVELLTINVFSLWINKSIEKLSILLPARYARAEENTAFISDINIYRYQSQIQQNTSDNSLQMPPEQQKKSVENALLE